MTATAALPSDHSTPVPAQPEPRRSAISLADMLEDGMYLIFLLKGNNPPLSGQDFVGTVDAFISQFERSATILGKPQAAIEHAKYAYCALLDEVILSSDFDVRLHWESAPLQLRLFGEHLAGERFFDKLDMLRMDPAANLETLEVFHLCLLAGFKGKYLLEDGERLEMLVNRLGQEITRSRGGRAEFAPNWKLPQRLQQYVRHELPLWMFYLLLAIVGLSIFAGYSWMLNREAERTGTSPAVMQPAGSGLLPGQPLTGGKPST